MEEAGDFINRDVRISGLLTTLLEEMEMLFDAVKWLP
jgi:hypothetical protein